MTGSRDRYLGAGRLARRGLVERVTDYIPGPTVYWRLTAAGARWEGTVKDMITPIRPTRYAESEGRV